MKSIFLLAAIITLGSYTSGSSVASAAPKYSYVQVPLDKADKRFGNFYTNALMSILYRPLADAPGPAIIWLHGCGGIGDWTLASAESDAEEFASLGYATLILDVGDQRGLGDKPCSDRKMSFSLLGARTGDIDAAALWLVKNNIALQGKVVTIGTSHGGEVAIEHDQKGGGTTKLAGAVAYYPGCDRGKPFARYPLLLLAGDADMTDGPRKSVGATCVDYARAANGAGGANVQAINYPGAPHSFDVKGVKVQVSQSLNKSISGYQESSAVDSLLRIKAFLAKAFQ